jgi:hypothetical protein
MSMKNHGGMILKGEYPRTRKKICPSATLSITNSTWTEPGANPGVRGQRQATNGLSHGTANSVFNIEFDSRNGHGFSSLLHAQPGRGTHHTSRSVRTGGSKRVEV